MHLSINAILLDPSPADHPILHRVLWFTPERFVVIFRLADDAWPTWVKFDDLLGDLDAGRLRLRPVDPFVPSSQDDETLGLVKCNVRDKRWANIKTLVADPKRRILFPRAAGRLISAVARLQGVSRKSLYKWLRLYWTWGQVQNALLPAFDNCGAPGRLREPGTVKRGRPNFGGVKGINCGEQERKLLQAGASLIKALGIQRAYDRVMEEHYGVPVIVNGEPAVHFPHPERHPSLRQFVYWAGKVRNPVAEIKAAKGQRRFELEHRPVLGSSSAMALYPGHVYQIDATIADAYLLSRLTLRRLIGRPVIYLVIDLYSRMIVGLYVGLAGPGWEGARSALANAMSNKVQFCRQYGVAITEDHWPCEGVMSELVSDRGPEFVSVLIEHVSKALNIVVSNLPAMRADWKGVVERRFGLLNEDAVDWVAGAVHERRDGGDYRLDAKYTLHSFTKLAIRLILHWNLRCRIDVWPPGFVSPDGANPRPIDLWRYGVRNLGGPQKADPLLITAGLLRRFKARETSRGLSTQSHLLYSSETALREGWFVRGRGRWRDHMMSIEDFNAGRAFVWFEDSRAPECAVLVGDAKRFEGFTLEEIADWSACRVAANSRNEAERLAAAATWRRQKEEIERAAAMESAVLLAGGKPRIDGIRQARANELRAERAMATRDAVDSSRQEHQTPDEEASNEDFSYQPAPSQLDRLRRLANLDEDPHDE